MSETTLRRIGWALSALFALFMLAASAAPKLFGMPITTEIMTGLGWPDAPIFLIGLMEVALTLLFLFPPTALLGAVLMTALLGGAIATNLQGHAPLFGNTLFGTYLGAVMWLALTLRDPRIRAVFPLVR